MDKQISVLFVPFGTDRVAATRYRVYQYLPYLKQHHIRYKVFSIISDWTTRQMIASPMFGNVRKLLYYLQLVLERILRFWLLLILSFRYKVIFIQRTSFPLRLEKVLQLVNKNIIFDLDDAIFISDKTEKGLINRIKELSKAAEVANILKVSRTIVVENNYIKNYVQKYCPQVYLIPGPIDTERNFVREKEVGKEVVIGWIGSPSTTVFLKMLHSTFQQLSKKYRITVKLIGAGQYQIPGVNVVNVDWCFATEVNELQSFDIGVMPMPDNEWTKGKLGCKMLQYMSVGVPAVVSYTQTNAEAIEDGVDGFLVTSDQDWVARLSLLIEDRNLRRNIGLAGRRTAEKRFSIKVNAPKFLDVLGEF